MNLHIISGRLGADPELRYTPNGTAVCNFRVATSRNWVDKQTGERHEQTEWHRVVVWGKLAEACGKNLAKGRWVNVQGESRTREWTDRDNIKRFTTEVHAPFVEFGPSAKPVQAKGVAQSMSNETSAGGSLEETDSLPSDVEMEQSAHLLDE